MLFNRKLTSALLREIYKNPLLFSYKKGRSVQNVLGFRLKLPDQWGSCFRCLACQPFIIKKTASKLRNQIGIFKKCFH